MILEVKTEEVIDSRDEKGLLSNSQIDAPKWLRSQCMEMGRIF